MIDHKQLLRLVDEAHAVLTPVQIAEMSISMDVTEVNLKGMLNEATAEWEAIKNDAATPLTAALKRLNALMIKHDNYGAMDTEGRAAVCRMEDAVVDGKKFPLRGRNPFSLYQSRPGWETASAELVEAAQVYYRALVWERYDIA